MLIGHAGWHPYILWNGIILQVFNQGTHAQTTLIHDSEPLWRWSPSMGRSSYKDQNVWKGELKNIWSKSVLTSYAKLVYVAQMLYGPQVFATKVAILLLLSRIFGVNNKIWWAIRVLIGFMALYYVPATAAKIFICWPVAHFWDPLTRKGTCLNENSIFLADCAMSIISDFTILFLPIPLIWGLKTGTMRKIGVSTVFGAGILYVSSAKRNAI